PRPSSDLVAVNGRAAALAQFLVHLAPDRVEAGLDADLRDARTHGAEPDNADPANFHGARSYAGAAACASSQRNGTSPWPGSCCVTTSSRTGSRPASRRSDR